MNREDLIAAMELTASRRLIPVTVPRWGTLHVKPPTVMEIEANIAANAAARAAGVAVLPDLIQAEAAATAAAAANPEDQVLAHAAAVAAAKVSLYSGKGDHARAAARIMRNEHGKRLFDPANEDDLVLLTMQPYSMLQAVLTAAEGDQEPDGGNSTSAASSSLTSQ